MSRNPKNNLINIANNKYNQLLSFLFFLLIAAPFSKSSGLLGLLLPSHPKITELNYRYDEWYS
jgi:hypothetical protein